ncbi:Mitochondrial metal transporter 2 [Seminavis robusta]|uniref:Mitochondrial metal transporter 2 n=1 Tax=Seminavis robusta TaxID=568900 RepID=A0A9N8HY15_9STRA|nr:Mitochondrial metal transporter 2 [Seminavis robusta]|eukprot:Sro2660_g333960.1 Mitochondrial metal transporter 2 (689) ;mRNA; f:6631-8774
MTPFWALVGLLASGSLIPNGSALSFHPTTSARRALEMAPSSAKLQLSSSYPQQRRQSALSMHMGHSHSHHHHQDDHAAQQQKPQPPPKTLGGKALRLSRSPVVRLAFAALVVFVPTLVRRRHLAMSQWIQRGDVAAFFLISAALTFANGAKNEVKRILDRVSDWKDGIAKHAPKARKQSLMERLFSKSREQSADRVTLFGVLINLVLSVGKLVVGVTCHSSALVADAGHSLSDLFSDFITLWAVQIARLPPDEDHPYGHGKFEAVGALFLALTLLGTGLSVGAVSYQSMLEIMKLQRTGGAAALAASVQVPTFPALLMAFLSIVSKEWLFRVTRNVGEDLNSQVVLANAWHHRSDAYSSILALVSIALAMLVPGLLAADSAAGLLVGGMICMTGAEIMGEAVKQLTDASADDSLVANVKQLALQESDDVLEVTRIRTRQMGSKAFVDVSIKTPESLSNSATRAVEERVKYTILKNEKNVVDADVNAKSSSAGVAWKTEEEHSHSHADHGTESNNSEVAEFSTSSTLKEEDDNDNNMSNGEEMSKPLEDSSADPTTTLADEMVGSFAPTAPTVAISSFQQIEDDARHLLNNHASIKSIEGCTVHYNEALQEVQVDVTIKVENPDWTTVTIAQSLARELKGILEEGSTNIHKANLFLDLNSADQKDSEEKPSLIYYLSEAINDSTEPVTN